MLIETNAEAYRKCFPNDPNPFISESFIELNKDKVDRIVRLIGESSKVALGLVAGIKNLCIKSPFSAPFGGFHYRNDHLYISVIDDFILQLKEYCVNQRLRK